jgi:hypothetical protein
VGNFTLYNGVVANRVQIVANGSIRSSFNVGSGADGIVGRFVTIRWENCHWRFFKF